MGLVKVLSQRPIADQLFSMTIESPSDLRKGYEPGQFLHFRITDSFDFTLRRPLSICKVDLKKRQITVVYRASGEGTRRLSRLLPGDQVDVIGPLGHGFPIHDEDQHAILIGGGIGVPPMVELGRHLQSRQIKITSVVGFASKRQAILLDELTAFGDVIVLSQDGSIGEEGLVTDALTDALCAGVSRYYACGPTPMLKAVKETMQIRNVPGYLSLEERMGCGIGICVGCVHPIERDQKVTNRKTCKEGPVFLDQEVVFS